MNEKTVIYLVRKSNQGCDGAKNILEIFKDILIKKYPELTTDGFWWYWKNCPVGKLEISNIGLEERFGDEIK